MGVVYVARDHFYNNVYIVLQIINVMVERFEVNLNLPLKTRKKKKNTISLYVFQIG